MYYCLVIFHVFDLIIDPEDIEKTNTWFLYEHAGRGPDKDSQIPRNKKYKHKARNLIHTNYK